MPKKKLTKAQVKRSLKSINTNLYRMIMERLDVPDNNIPISTPKLMELHRTIESVSTKIYNVEFPDWLNDSRTVEQLLVRLVLVYLTARETGVM